jgi:hypothetical protein
MSPVIQCTLALVLALPSVPVAWAGDDPPPVSSTAFCRDLSRSLRVEPRLLPAVVDMCRRAPTFTRQLARIADEPGLMVTIDVWRTPWSDQVRGRTELHLKLGHLRSAGMQIRIDDPDRIVELIAHEFEHILEQLDGIDLNRWVGRSGVYRVWGNDRVGAIETARARYVGRKVAAEYAGAPFPLARSGSWP